MTKYAKSLSCVKSQHGMNNYDGLIWLTGRRKGKLHTHTTPPPQNPLPLDARKEKPKWIHHRSIFEQRTRICRGKCVVMVCLSLMTFDYTLLYLKSLHSNWCSMFKFGTEARDNTPFKPYGWHIQSGCAFESQLLLGCSDVFIKSLNLLKLWTKTLPITEETLSIYMNKVIHFLR